MRLRERVTREDQMLEGTIQAMLLEPPHIEFLVAPERRTLRGQGAACAGEGVRRLRVLVVHAHPLKTSFVSALHARIIETLRASRHEVDDLDLYAERFDPVLPAEQMQVYVDARRNTATVQTYVEQLRAADALAVVFPVWFDGLPAILQGYFQRVFLPGVATVIDERGLFHANLQNIKRMGAVAAYGEHVGNVMAKQDPPRRFVRDNIGVLTAPDDAVRISRDLRHGFLDRAAARSLPAARHADVFAVVSAMGAKR